MRPTLVDLMRHGEPVGGVRFRGNVTDDPLSNLGWSQMWDAVGDHHPWDQLISSPWLAAASLPLRWPPATGCRWP